MAEVASLLRPYARHFAIEPTRIQIFNGTHSPASFLEIGDTCDLGSLYLRLIAEGNEVRIFIAEKECRHRPASWHGQLPLKGARGGVAALLTAFLGTKVLPGSSFACRQVVLNTRPASIPYRTCR
jgi:hypothetical protein